MAGRHPKYADSPSSQVRQIPVPQTVFWIAWSWVHAPLLSLPSKGEASGCALSDQTKAYWPQQAVPHLSSLFSAALRYSNYAGSVSAVNEARQKRGRNGQPSEEPEHRMHVPLFPLPTKEEASSCTLSDHTKLCQQQQPAPQSSLFSVVHRYLNYVNAISNLSETRQKPYFGQPSERRILDACFTPFPLGKFVSQSVVS